MFPLSTPTNGGLGIDLLSLAIVFAGLAAFVVGLADLWTRVRAKTGRAALPDLDPVTLAAYAALGLVGLAVAIMLAGVPGIPVAQAVFLAIAAWGVAAAAGRASRVWEWLQSASGADLARAALFAAAACWSIWFWAGVFQDHVALPVELDGIAHTAWYLRIIESGMPTLGRVPILFPTIFGTQMIEFYPTGTHALIAISSGFWGQWGIVSHAGILKAWFTLAVAAAPWALVWMAHRLMPRMPWWIGLVLVFVATPGFRFPVEAAHEGGASRIFAHVLMAPIYADIILGRFTRWRGQALAAIFLGVAFLIHPTAFVTFAALLVCGGVCATAGIGWRTRLLRILAPACAVAVGGVIAWGLLRWNGADVLPRTVEAFSWADLGRRLLRGWNTLFDHNYGMDGIKAWLIVAGLLLLVLRRRALGVSWRVVAFLACVVLVAAVALAARVLSLPGFDLIAGAYYDEPARTVEVLYEAVGFCLIGLAWSVWSLVRGRADHVPLHPRRGRTASAIATVLVVGAVGYQQARTAWVYDHIGFWDRKFKTPRISRLQAVGAWIQQNTEQNAIIFHLPFDAEVWEAWTGRRGSFMYSECYAHNDRRPCIARRELVNGRIDVLRHAFDEPAAAERCLTEIDRFGQPGYFLVRAPVASTRSFPVCSDAVYVTSLDSHAIFRYRRP